MIFSSELAKSHSTVGLGPPGQNTAKSLLVKDDRKLDLFYILNVLYPISI